MEILFHCGRSKKNQRAERKTGKTINFRQLAYNDQRCEKVARIDGQAKKL